MSPDPARSLFGCPDGTPSGREEQERLDRTIQCPSKAPDATVIPLTSLDEYIEDCGNRKITCPNQSVTSFWDANSETFHLFRGTCKTWTCPYCGHVKRARLQADISAAKPNRFITLTTCGQPGETPRQIFDWTRRQLSELSKQYRREGREFEYLRALEATQLGFPHYHLLVRSQYLDQKELSHRWAHLTRAFIVDIRSLTRDENASRYVMKYLTKAGSVPFTKRRLSWTKKFFPPAQPQPPTTYCPVDVNHYRGSLEDVTFWEFPNRSWEKLNQWHWIKRGGADL